MAGGFFSGDTAAPARLDTDMPMGVTYESSPGGFFDGGADPQTSASAASSASDAENYAEQARGWAVGPTTEPLTGWSATNNSKYYSEQAAISDRNAAASASAAAADAARAETAAERAEGFDSDAAISAADARRFRDQADSDARAAATSAANAATSAANAASSAAAAANSASDASQSARDAARFDSEARAWAEQAEAFRDQAGQYRDEARGYAMAAAQDSEGAARSAAAAATSATNAANSAAQADSDQLVAKSWAVGPSGTGTKGTDTNNAHYWALVARDAADLETVQFDFVVPTAAPGTSYSNGRIDITDSDLYIDDPIVSYNGVVLSDGDHYSWDSDHIIFTSSVGIETGDCITVTAGGERENNFITRFKAVVAASTDFADFKTRVAAL